MFMVLLVCLLGVVSIDRVIVALTILSTLRHTGRRESGLMSDQVVNVFLGFVCPTRITWRGQPWEKEVLLPVF